MQAVVEPPGALASHLEKITNQELAFTVTHSQYHASKARNNGIFGKLAKQSYREKNKAILFFYQDMQNSVFHHFAVPISLIYQIQSLFAMFPKFGLVMYQLHDLCHT